FSLLLVGVTSVGLTAKRDECVSVCCSFTLLQSDLAAHPIRSYLKVCTTSCAYVSVGSSSRWQRSGSRFCSSAAAHACLVVCRTSSRAQAIRFQRRGVHRRWR